MTNLLTRVNYETRMALHDQEAINKAMGMPSDEPTDSTKSRISNATDTLLEYMLFADEAPLQGPIQGSTDFAAEYQRRGPRSKRGLSLRDLDLKTRLFRHPCSPLIYSEAFDALPAPAKDRIYQRLWEILSGKDDSKTYARLSPADRRAILEILLETSPSLPLTGSAQSPRNFPQQLTHREIRVATSSDFGCRRVGVAAKGIDGWHHVAGAENSFALSLFTLEFGKSHSHTRSVPASDPVSFSSH